MGLHQGSNPSLGPCDETDKDPTLPEVRFPCARVSLSPSPDFLGSVRHPQAGPDAGTIMRDESVADDSMIGPESCGDQAADQRHRTTTMQSVRTNGPSVGEATPDHGERSRLSSESQAPVFSRLGPRNRLVKPSNVPLINTRSLRPRRKAESTRPKRLPAISVVIPNRRNVDSVASTKTNPPTRARPYRRLSGIDSGNLNYDRPVRTETEEYAPFSGGSSSKARGRPRKRAKRAVEDTSSSTNDVTGKCISQSSNPLDGGFAVTLGKTQEIFGRGVLRIQSHGLRHAYFMTFLPEVTDPPSMVSPSEMHPDLSPHPDDFSENAFSRHGVCKGGRKRTVSPASEDADAWSIRHSTSLLRNSRSRTDRNKAQQKSRRRLPWSSEEVDLLLKLRRDEQRPWSEVTRLFSDRYPGRSPGAIQVYWSTVVRQA